MKNNFIKTGPKPRILTAGITAPENNSGRSSNTAPARILRYDVTSFRSPRPGPHPRK
ncbi:hypothetical protein ABIE64_004226 [Thalassospira sp. MBR-102]